MKLAASLCYTQPVMILASTSPYRRAALKVVLETSLWSSKAPSFDERTLDGLFRPEEAARHAIRLAEGKAVSVAEENNGQWVLGADELVILDGEMLHKPSSLEEACDQLFSLSGQTIQVITGLCAIRLYTSRRHSSDPHHLQFDRSRRITQAVEHEVTVKALDRKWVETYITTFRPLNCVGSFRLTDPGIADIFEPGDWEAEPSNLQGFPLHTVCRNFLHRMGFRGRRAPKNYPLG